MSKLIALILLVTLCGCGGYQTQEQVNRIQFKDYNQLSNTSLSIVVVDSIEFLVNHQTGQMVRITKEDNK